MYKSLHKRVQSMAELAIFEKMSFYILIQGVDIFNVLL